MATNPASTDPNALQWEVALRRLHTIAPYLDVPKALSHQSVIIWFKTVEEVTVAARELYPFNQRWCRSNRTADRIYSADYKIGETHRLVIARLGDDLAPTFHHVAHPPDVERPVLTTSPAVVTLTKKSESDTHLQLGLSCSDIQTERERQFFEEHLHGPLQSIECGVVLTFEKPINHIALFQVFSRLSRAGFRVEIADELLG